MTPRNLKKPVSALCLLLALTSQACATPSTSGECFGSLRSALAAGNYSGDLDCTRVSMTLSVVGTINIAQDKYDIYDMRYRTIPDEPGMSPHGGQRIMLLKNETEYVGQFPLNTPPFHQIVVQGASIYLEDVTKEHGNEIDFNQDGPPHRVFLDQDVKLLFK